MGEQIIRSLDGSALTREEVLKNFEDLHLPLNPTQARVESSRCLFCYDAPCIKACPTSIDIPGFIKQISTDNLSGAAKTILDSNIMGGTCARVCPTEILCEGSCVMNKTGEKPIEIGQLQRHAVDHLMENAKAHPYARAPHTGKNIAVVGAGPAGLACAHALARKGHAVTVFEKRAKPGGLNEYGIAAYKMTDDFAQKEVQFLLDVGGISLEYGKVWGTDFTLDSLKGQFDAVFLGIGLGLSRALELTDSDTGKIQSALEFIEELRQVEDKASFTIPQKVVVIGGGNTAIDAAVQAKRLGAAEVTMVYRRGAKQMGATTWEQELAKNNDVRMVYWASPESAQVHSEGKLSVRFTRTHLVDGKLAQTGEILDLPADLVLTAIGQKIEVQGTIEISGGKIAVDDQYQSSIPGVFAGGDCIATGEDLTVQAVEDGKQAAESIHRFVMEEKNG